MRFFHGSFVDLGFVDFQHSIEMRGVLFFFQFSYSENLPDKLVLLERGTRGVNGYFIIYLEKGDQGRVPKMELTNDTTSLKFEAESFFEEK